MSVYHSPSTDICAGLDELKQVVTEFLVHSNHIIIAGDLNIDLGISTCDNAAYNVK